MTSKLARIRVEAARLYAEQHPEVSYADLAKALKFASKGDLATWFKRIGYNSGRVRGVAAPSYTREGLATTKKAIAALLKLGEFTYQEIADKVGCSRDPVYKIAKQLGLGYGQGHNPPKRGK